MYIFKNSLKSIIRNKTRNILIFVLVLLIAISACIALSIKNSADLARETMSNSLSITAQINTNRQKIMGEQPNLEDKSQMKDMLSQRLSIDELKNYATSEYVDNFYYTCSVSLNSSSDMEVYETTNSNVPEFGGKEMGGPRGGMQNQGDISIVGYNSHDGMTTFIDGENVISDGSVFDEGSTDNSCVISYELATLNDFSVGDTITLSNPNKETETYKFIISGIFKNETSDVYANQIYTSYESLKNIIDSSSENAEEIENDMGMTMSTALMDTTNGFFVFSNIDNYENFCKDVETMGLDTDTYTVSSSDVNAFEQSLLPLNNLSKFTMIFFVVILIIGALILIVFNIFSIREKKYEIGVLTAICMKKSKVATQFLLEIFIVTMCAILAGTAIGALASKPVGNYLLDEQIQSIQTDMQNQNKNFGGNFQGTPPSMGGDMPDDNKAPNSENGAPENPGVAGNNYITDIDTTTDISVLLSLMGMSLILTLLSGSVGIISILKYDPLKILSNRT